MQYVHGRFEWRSHLFALLAVLISVSGSAQTVPLESPAGPLPYPVLADETARLADELDQAVKTGSNSLTPFPSAPVPSAEVYTARVNHSNAKELEQYRDALIGDLTESMLELQRQSAVLRKIAQAVRPSVVHVVASKRQDTTKGQRHQPRGSDEPTDAFVEEAGSGVIVELDGKPYVLTNRHVIKDAAIDLIQVSLANRQRLKPTRLWSDESTDVAVLAIDEPNVLPARLGNSDQIEIGDLVLAIGSPFGLSHSVTHGIISAKGRRDLYLGNDDVRIQDFLQTDAAINPGNSGGPLINMRGEVIGLNTAIASNSGGNEGIGFSIPINMAMHVAHQLVTQGYLARVYLGVSLDQDFEGREVVSRQLPPGMGTRISRVTKGSPADQAELRQGDIILQFNGIDVENDSHLVRLVGLSPIGVEVPLRVLRDGELTTRIVMIQERRE